jgi:hypothetical protein
LVHKFPPVQFTVFIHIHVTEHVRQSFFLRR